jgi:hypothetical protein
MTRPLAVLPAMAGGEWRKRQRHAAGATRSGSLAGAGGDGAARV